jgi:hypothetical protein
MSEIEHCQCSACRDGVIHASDCAVHNMPAQPNGRCDCGAVSFTPGPWLISKESPRIVVQGDFRGEPTNTLIGSACGYPDSGFFPNEDEGAANARLIAAAPELLEALMAITDQLEHIGDTRPHKDGEYIEMARAAIAKATGAAS